MDNIDDIVKKRTGTEAINAKAAVDDYLKEAYSIKDVSAHCLAQNHSALRCPNVEKCTCMACMVNVSVDLQYLLSKYSHALGRIYQNSTSNAASNSSDEAELDLLEMTFSRFSNQMQRYLQAGKKSCGDTAYNGTAMRNVYINHQEIDGRIRAQPATGYKESAHVILCQLRRVAVAVMDTLKKENCSLFGYKFCSSLDKLTLMCKG